MHNPTGLSARAGGKQLILSYLQILAGCVIGAAAYPAFLTPNAIAPGGLTGLAIVLNTVIPVHVGTLSLLMNIPLFLLGWQRMGTSFALRSLCATFLFSLLIDLLPIPALTNQPLLATLYGGLLLGIGLGLILRGNATTGGTDMAARIVHRLVPSVSVGTFLFLFDFIVVILSGILNGMEDALYAIICIYLSDRVVDAVLLGGTHSKACFIISDAWERISRRLMDELERGVTQLSARGAWSGKDRPVLLCVTSVQEIPRLKAIVHAEDDAAFVFITNANETLGEGFSDWKSD